MSPGERPPAGTPGPGLQPPGTHPHSIEKQQGSQPLIWVALAGVVLLGLAVLFVLPKLVSDPAEKEQLAELPPATAIPKTPVIQNTANSQAEAEQALQDFLRTRARLELANVMAWGEPEWSQVIADADRGNNLFTQRQFAMAAELFTKATQTLLTLESGRDQRRLTTDVRGSGNVAFHHFHDHILFDPREAGRKDASAIHFVGKQQLPGKNHTIVW